MKVLRWLILTIIFVVLISCASIPKEKNWHEGNIIDIIVTMDELLVHNFDWDLMARDVDYRIAAWSCTSWYMVEGWREFPMICNVNNRCFIQKKNGRPAVDGLLHEEKSWRCHWWREDIYQYERKKGKLRV